MMTNARTSEQTHPLVRRVAEEQHRNGWSDGAMAAHLCLPRSTWTALRNGSRQPGLRTINAIKLAYRDWDLNVYLASRARYSDQTVTGDAA
jgi:hypothetical protein